VKKYPKIVQCDKRGQIVIPKDIREELGIGEGTGFWAFSISDEGILLKKIPREDLPSDSPIIQKLKEKSDKIPLKKKSIDKAVDTYKKSRSKNNLEEL
jgi:AbrB family looped-hinge helix DNA binding protein